ncbi:hypothetical protein BEL04_14485 [Mucilaginibacter sp. PPCGB 2223]|uniref:hypothetical protein n=1 Tax=Mucilaginibacter sp. PPCGB 2223 TaxID=1886027 RepID=UPI00082492BF|nr:hypothetical protein [Mucilaginibacter sp. PPCGB 2223]OCX52650.1 hypothetical protein BEL04_14485 [Mucilaginibacter sp. PPCGB 2223]
MKKHTTKKLGLWALGLIVVLAVIFIGTKSIFGPKESINVADVEIKLPAGKTSVKIGSTENAVISALGQPKQIAPYSSQASYKQGTVLNYNGAKFYFVKNKLTNFEITSHKFKVGLAGNRYTTSIGNTTRDLPHLKIQDNAAFLDVKSDDATTDQYLEYDMGENGRVTKILYSDY